MIQFHLDFISVIVLQHLRFESLKHVLQSMMGWVKLGHIILHYCSLFGVGKT